MPSRDGGSDAALRGLAVGSLALLGVIATGLALSTVWGIAERRQYAEAHAGEDCTEGKSCSRESLHADVRAAIAAEDIVDLAIWQLVQGVVGLAGVGLTVFYARLAWREAAKSATAALAAFEADNRTWVTVKAVEIGSITWENDGTPRIRVVLEIKNIGSQPAFAVHPMVKVFIGEAGVWTDARDRLIEWARKLAEVPGYEGETLLPGEKTTPKFTMGAERDVETDKRMAQFGPAFGTDSLRRNSAISVVYCAHYKSPSSNDWRVSAGVVMVSKKTVESFSPEFGNVLDGDISAIVLGNQTKMT